MNDIPAPNPPPPMRCPDLALPSYRYIPGKHPHPIKHPDGHQHQTPPIPTPRESADWQTHPAWLRGLDLFHHRFYWECHEQLEAIWKCLPSETHTRGMVQGVIQGAAYRLKWHMGHKTAAATLLIASRTRLLAAKEHLGEVIWGIHIDSLVDQLDTVKSEDTWPSLGL